VVNKYGLGFRVRDLGVQESGLDQDPYKEKFTFKSITRVPAIRVTTKIRPKSKNSNIGI
jgi:hypothetical protein